MVPRCDKQKVWMCLFQICLNGFALFPVETGCAGSVRLGFWGCQPSNFVCLHSEGIIADLKNTHFALAHVRREPSPMWPTEHAVCAYMCGASAAARKHRDAAMIKHLHEHYRTCVFLERGGGKMLHSRKPHHRRVYL